MAKFVTTKSNFKIALYYIEDRGERVFVSTYKSVSAAEKDAKEILLANNMVGREYLVAYCNEDLEIIRELHYVCLTANGDRNLEIRLTAYTF